MRGSDATAEAGDDLFDLRLYIAGEGPNSVAAKSNLSTICREFLSDRCRVEVVDVFLDPKRALRDHVMVTPLLIKLAPDPVRRIAGTLNDLPKVLHALGIIAIAGVES